MLVSSSGKSTGRNARAKDGNRPSGSTAQASSAGGAATSGGTNFEDRVAAWFAVSILAEQAAVRRWGISDAITFELIRCQTGQPVDDALVGMSNAGFLFVQAKHSLNRSSAEKSDLASAIDQCVRQVLAFSENSAIEPWERALDPERDRVLVLTSSASPLTVRQQLRNLLNRIRGLSTGQSLDAAAVNADERTGLEVLRTLVRRSWVASRETGPSERELRNVLNLLYIDTLDVDPGGSDEDVAKTTLRTAVLADPGQTEGAWRILIDTCSRLAADRSGTDRRRLQAALIDAQIGLQGVRSYWTDIERLRQQSDKMLDLLAAHSSIHSEATPVQIRRAFTDELLQAAESGSLLLVGEPGAGKTGALVDLARSLQSKGRDVIFLTAEDVARLHTGEVPAASWPAHELAEVLENWPGTQPGFLIVDALDSVRMAPQANTLRAQIQILLDRRTRWHVVTSMRQYDLRYSQQIRRTFAGAPISQSPRFRNPEFGTLRHLWVSLLTDDELQQVAEASPTLADVLKDATPLFRDLLRNPFNLELVAELLSGGLEASAFVGLRTQMELLDRYWLERVIGSDGQGDTREGLLRQASEHIVEGQVTHIARRLLTGDSGTNAALVELLRQQILIEWQQTAAAPPDYSVLTFAHLILFDYAVARLLLREPAQAVAERFARQGDLIFAIAPSVRMHYQYLWSIYSPADEHPEFWELARAIAGRDEIRDVGKTAGPVVAAQLASDLPELEPLCRDLESSDTAVQRIAEGILRHLVGAILVEPRPVRGVSAGPWCALAERVSRTFRIPTAYIVKTSLAVLCEVPEELTGDQRECAGQAARRLLAFVWDTTPYDQWLIIYALQAVCRTFESDALASANLLRRVIAPEHMAQYGYLELPRVAEELGRIIPADPALVGDIFRASFAYEETSSETTAMGTGRILSLTSNRRQDYQMALYELANAFPAFLAQAPEFAVPAFIAALHAFVHAHHHIDALDNTFDFDGREAHIQTDHCSIWDRGPVRNEDAVRLLDAFEQYLDRLASAEDEGSALQAVIELVGEHNHTATLWRRVLAVAARHPSTLGTIVRPLLWAVPVLTCADTQYEAGELMSVCYPILDRQDRERIERAILDIPSQVSLSRREIAEYIRSRYLGCLPDDLVLEETRALRNQLQLANGIPPNAPRITTRPAEWSPYEEQEYLAEQGVPVAAELSQSLRALEQPVREFVQLHMSAVPTFDEVGAITPALREVFEALEGDGDRKRNASGAHPVLQKTVWSHLAQACARIAFADWLTVCDSEPGSLIRRILLAASLNPEPEQEPGNVTDEESFDNFPTWGDQDIRVWAAEGLTVLARHSGCCDHEVVNAIERLSADLRRAVRFGVAQYLAALRDTASTTMWAIIERMAAEDSSYAVLQRLVASTLVQLVSTDPQRVGTLTQAIYQRTADKRGTEVRKSCMDVFTHLYFVREDPLGAEAVTRIVDGPSDDPEVTMHLISSLRDTLTYGSAAVPEPEANRIRLLALDFIRRLLRSAIARAREVRASESSSIFEEWQESNQQQYKALIRIIDMIGRELYFASGAFDEKRSANAGQRVPLDRDKRIRFYREASDIIDDLGSIGLASLTHHLVEMLETYIPHDPADVFLRIATIMRSGESGGYQNEGMAADLVVRIIERYLADYSAVFRERPDCRDALLDVLDQFVQVGWPSARHLTYRLDEIYR